MGYRNDCCRCPEAWADFIDRWVYIHLVGGRGALYQEAWQLVQVQETYLVFRRHLPNSCRWQRVVIPCQHIAALVEAQEAAVPVMA